MDAIKTGGLISQVRREKELTQRDLAEGLHVSVQAVSKWERGLSCPDIGLLEPLAEALDLTVTELLAGQRGEEPKDEVVRDSLRLGETQLRPQIRRWRWLFLLTAALLLSLVLWWGYVWVRDNTELLPQRTTVVRPLDVTNREATLAHAAGKTAGFLYQVDFADGASQCSFRWELWTHEGLERSWDVGEQLRQDDVRHKLVGVTLLGSWHSPAVQYRIALESPSGTAMLGLNGALEVPYMGDGYGMSPLGKRVEVDREEGIILLALTLTLRQDGSIRAADLIDCSSGKMALPPESETAAYLLLRMYCE